MDPIYRITLPFRDIDMHGHMHNAAYVSHFEAAISQFLSAHQLSADFAPTGDTVFVVRKSDVTYEAPCHYDDRIEIVIDLAYLGRSSLAFRGEMRGAAGDLRASAVITWICVDRVKNQSKPIEDRLRTKLGAFLPNP